MGRSNSALLTSCFPSTSCVFSFSYLNDDLQTQWDQTVRSTIDEKQPLLIQNVWYVVLRRFRAMRTDGLFIFTVVRTSQPQTNAPCQLRWTRTDQFSHDRRSKPLENSKSMSRRSMPNSCFGPLLEQHHCPSHLYVSLSALRRIRSNGDRRSLYNRAYTVKTLPTSPLHVEKQTRLDPVCHLEK